MDDTSISITVIEEKETKVVAIVEVKKSINADLCVQQNMSLYGEYTMNGMLTEVSVWHCLEHFSTRESITACHIKSQRDGNVTTGFKNDVCYRITLTC